MTINWAGIRTVIGSFMMLLIVGTVYLWGSTVVYFVSYMRLQGDDISLNVGGAVFPFMMISIGCGMTFSVKVVNYFGGSRVPLFICTVGMSFCIFISSYITDFYLFVFVYGICFGFIAGIVYLTVLYLGFMYFPNHRGKVSGISLCGQGLGTFVYSFMVQAILNPEGLKAIKESDGKKYFIGNSAVVAERVPELLRWLALVYFIQMNIANFLIKEPPEFKRNLDLQKQQEEQEDLQLIQKINEENYQQKQQKQVKGAQPQVQAQEPSSKSVDQTKETKELTNLNDGKHIIMGYKSQMGQFQDSEQNNNNNNLKAWNLFSQSQDFQGKAMKEEKSKISDKPVGDQMPIELAENSDSNTNKSASSQEVKIAVPAPYPNACPAVKYVFKSWVFYYAILLFMNGAGLGLLISAQYKSYYSKYTDNDVFLTLVGSMSSLANGIFRPIWGFVYDRYTFRQIYTGITLVNLLLSATLSTAAKNQYVYLVWIFLIMGTYGGVLSYCPSVFAKLFGVQIGFRVFGTVWMGLGIANFFQYILVILTQPSIDYAGIFWIYFAINLLTLIIIQVVDLKYDWRPKIEEYLKERREMLSKMKI